MQSVDLTAQAQRSATAAVDLCIIAAMAILLRTPLLNSSDLDWDESAFALAARELLQGHLPYVTFFDVKPVGSAALIALAMAAFGQSLVVLHGLGVAAVAATAGLLYAIALRIGLARGMAACAAVFYLLFSTRLHGAATMTEILLAPFTASGVLILLGQWQPDMRRKTYPSIYHILRYGAAGLLFGMAIWIKSVPVVPAAVIGGFALLILLVVMRRKPLEIAACGFIFGAAAVLPTGMTVLIYWRAGVLPEFLYANFGFAKHYYTMTTADRRLDGLREVVTEIWPLVGLFLIAFLPPLQRSMPSLEGRGMRAVIICWVVAEGVAASLNLQFWPNYFLLILPPLCLTAAMAIASAARLLPARGDDARVAMAIAAALVVLPAIRHGDDMARLAVRPDTWRTVTAMVKRHLRPGDMVWAANASPFIYFLAHTDLPTRYAFPTHLIGFQRGLARVDHEAEIRRILDGRPRVIVVDENSAWIEEQEIDPYLKALIERRLVADYTLRDTLNSADDQVRARIFVLND